MSLSTDYGELDAIEPPNYRFSARETPGQGLRGSALLATALPQYPEPSERLSERSMRRRRQWRRNEVEALLARDGRVTIESAIARVKAKRNRTTDRWLKTCDECSGPFEAVRDDARFCSDRCRKRAARSY